MKEINLFILHIILSWWRHQMETFSALLVICAGNSPVTGEFPAQRPLTRGFDVFFDLHLNKRLSKQSWGWWFKTPSRPLWRHWNAMIQEWEWIVMKKLKTIWCVLVDYKNGPGRPKSGNLFLKKPLKLSCLMVAGGPVTQWARTLVAMVLLWT